MKDTLYDDAQATGGMFHAESGLDVRYYDDGAAKISLDYKSRISITLPKEVAVRVGLFLYAQYTKEIKELGNSPKIHISGKVD